MPSSASLGGCERGEGTENAALRVPGMGRRAAVGRAPRPSTRRLQSSGWMIGCAALRGGLSPEGPWCFWGARLSWPMSCGGPPGSSGRSEGGAFSGGWKRDAWRREGPVAILLENKMKLPYHYPSWKEGSGMRRFALALSLAIATGVTLLPSPTEARHHSHRQHRPQHRFVVSPSPFFIAVTPSPVFIHQGFFHPHAVAPVIVIPPQPAWVPGSWHWNGLRWVWVPGHWVGLTVDP